MNMVQRVRQWIRQGRWSNRLLITLAVVFGLITAVLVYMALSDGGGKDEETVVATSEETVPVVVADRDIRARTRITEEMLDVRVVPKDAAHPDAFSSKEDLEGMVSRVPIIAEEQILEDKVVATATELRRDGDDLPLSYVVRPGQRAISIEVNEISSAGGLIIPGDFVDVIGIFDVEFFGVREGDPTSRETVDDYVALTVLQNVEVLAVAQDVTETVPEGDEAGVDGDGAIDDSSRGEEVSQQSTLPEPSDPNPDATTVALAVSPAQAQILALAEERGTLKLSLRGVSDTEDALTPALSSFELLPPDLPNPFAR
jgi:pilus assembly protein CpaB